MNSRPPFRADRRKVIGTIAAVAGVGLAGPAGWQLSFAAPVVVEDIKDLKPGQYTWHPERSPDGPVAIVVSLPDQLVHIYRNGIRIAVSTCSSGKPGYETPTGVFTILQKDKDHKSSTYNEASMPNTNRLTWSGVALHAGGLPGYPSSHGCVHLPLEFSALLFGITYIGAAVIIAGSHADPTDIVHPGLILTADAEAEMDAAVAALKARHLPSNDHSNNHTPPVSIIVSGADSKIIILQNGDIVAQGGATIADAGKPLGSNVFILSGAHSSGQALQWQGIGHDAGADAAPSSLDVLRRIRGDTSVVEVMKTLLHPGLIFVTTDLPLHPSSRSGKDFVVVSTEDA